MNLGISASKISQITNLQMTTVAYTLLALKDKGLIKEIGSGEPSFQGGKPPILWDLSPSYGFIVGIEIIPHEIRLVLLDFSGKIILKETTPHEFYYKKYNKLIIAKPFIFCYIQTNC